MQRQAIKNIALAFIAVLVAFTSCRKEDKELTVEMETIEFTINPTESKTVNIYSDTDWSVEILHGRSEWIFRPDKAVLSLQNPSWNSLLKSANVCFLHVYLKQNWKFNGGCEANWGYRQF